MSARRKVRAERIYYICKEAAEGRTYILYLSGRDSARRKVRAERIYYIIIPRKYKYLHTKSCKYTYLHTTSLI
jgi:hypothetical protein